MSNEHTAWPVFSNSQTNDSYEPVIHTEENPTQNDRCSPTAKQITEIFLLRDQRCLIHKQMILMSQFFIVNQKHVQSDSEMNGSYVS